MQSAQPSRGSKGRRRDQGSGWIAEHRRKIENFEIAEGRRKGFFLVHENMGCGWHYSQWLPVAVSMP